MVSRSETRLRCPFDTVKVFLSKIEEVLAIEQGIYSDKMSYYFLRCLRNKNKKNVESLTLC